MLGNQAKRGGVPKYQEQAPEEEREALGAWGAS